MKENCEGKRFPVFEIEKNSLTSNDSCLFWQSKKEEESGLQSKNIRKNKGRTEWEEGRGEISLKALPKWEERIRKGSSSKKRISAVHQRGVSREILKGSWNTSSKGSRRKMKEKKKGSFESKKTKTTSKTGDVRKGGGVITRRGGEGAHRENRGAKQMEIFQKKNISTDQIAALEVDG